MIKNKAYVLVFLLLVTIFSIPLTSAEDSDEQLYTLSGKVFDADGQLANKTSIKVDSMTSTWSENGSYVFSGITPGEHTVRAYFMNSGHTVVYRRMIFDSDMELDWQVGKNWITVEAFDNQGIHIQDSSNFNIEIVGVEENNDLEDGRVEYGPLNIGEYFTIIANYENFESSQFLHFKMSASQPNDFNFQHGMNSRYGFVVDEQGFPMSGVSISNGIKNAVTNSDGFFLIQNLEVGTIQTFTIQQSGIDIIDPVVTTIIDGEGWMNLSSTYQVELPRNVSFITQFQTIPMSPFEIDWEGGPYTDFYSLYLDGELAYRGTSTTFSFSPQDTGTFEFRIEATNINGSNDNASSLLLIVLPNSSDSELWSLGMSWDYEIEYTPSSPYNIHNVTITAIGTESTIDAFGHEKTSFLARYSDEHDIEGEESYRWVDSQNLLTLHTYWVDSPSSSSYYQEGILGWDFTDSNGLSTDIFSSQDEELNLHFNRTNIIGVPGHPNGYDDTYNTVSIVEDVILTTPAGTFSTTHITITDNDDGVISWELWYNASVRNWVKIIDQLPGSHSDKKVSILKSFDVPMNPMFLTEESNLSVNEYSITWAPFQGTDYYQLFENDILIYEGNQTNQNISNQKDGNYDYQINSIMLSGYTVFGEKINLNIFHIAQPPVFLTTSQVLNSNDEIIISWTPITDAEWYNVTVIDRDGNKNSIYNGSENYSLIDDLSIGQNRIRVQVGLTNDKISDFSSSIFITIEENESNNSIQNLAYPAVIILILIILVTSVIYRNRWSE